MEQPNASQFQPTIWNLLTQAGPTDLKTIKGIHELDRIEKPDYAESAEGPGSVDD
jgi:hypothetical protein